MICTAMIQVDCCGWVVCGKPADHGNRCNFHMESHAIEKMADDELFAHACSRIRMQIAKQVRETAYDDVIKILQELKVNGVVDQDEDWEATTIDECIRQIKAER